MKILKNLPYLLLLIVIFIACKSSTVNIIDDRKIEFTFLQLNDVYEIAPIQGGTLGGMARVETVHKELLKENNNTLLFMAGDFLNPSLLGALKLDGERIAGKHMIDVMNSMNFDLVAFGNHEFDLKQESLQKRLNESSFPWITGNTKLRSNGKVMSFYKETSYGKSAISPTYIFHLEDTDGTKIKIGFISICIPSNPKQYVEYSDMFDQAKTTYNSIKNNVDVVFGLTHAEITHDKKIAALLPNIPLIMGGHEHENMSIPVGNSVITKADANAKTVYIHRISFDKQTKETIIKSELREINNSIKADEQVGAVVEKWQQVLKTKIKEIVSNPEEIIYTTKKPLDGRDKSVRSKQTNLGQIITKSMSFSYNDEVDCAIVNGGSIRIDDELEGAISPIDIFRVLPFGGSVIRVEIKGFLLKRVLDYGLLAKGTGAYLQYFNARKVDYKWQIEGKELNLDKIYKVAFSDYLLKGLDIPFLSNKNKEVFSIYQPKEKELAFDIRLAVLEYLKFITKKNIDN